MTAANEKTRTLSPRQHQAIGHLMSEATIIEAAQKTGVDERTLRRWIEEPVFASTYRTARHQALAHTTARLQEATAEAVATLKALMADDETPRSSRIMAARTILEFGYRSGEGEVQEQLRELERRYDQLQALLFERAEGHDGRV